MAKITVATIKKNDSRYLFTQKKYLSNTPVEVDDTQEVRKLVHAGFVKIIGAETEDTVEVLRAKLQQAEDENARLREEAKRRAQEARTTSPDIHVSIESLGGPGGAENAENKESVVAVATDIPGEAEETRQSLEKELEVLDRAKLKAYVSKNELEFVVTKGMSEVDIRKGILDKLFPVTQ